jgi:hypothetical protein
MAENIALAVFVLLLAVICGLLWRLGRRSAPPVVPRARGPGVSVIVDGSNAMYWGGEASLSVLRRVIRTLEEQGENPYVIFDANVGWKLFDRYCGDGPMSRHLGLQERQVMVVSKGEIADEKILLVADKFDLPVVSNDRFRDWSVRFPWVRDHRRLRRGAWVEGHIRWGGARRKRG